MIGLIVTFQDASREKSFSGSCQWLIEWFRGVQDVLPPLKKLLNANALEKATDIFLDSLLTEPPKEVTKMLLLLRPNCLRPSRNYLPLQRNHQCGSLGLLPGQSCVQTVNCTVQNPLLLGNGLLVSLMISSNSKKKWRRLLDR